MNRSDYIKHYTEIQEPDHSHYRGSSELLSIGSPFAKIFGLKKLGIHHELVPPGRRTSWPHAESDEEEFVYVIEGEPDVWIDGCLHRLKPGDGVGFACGTGICTLHPKRNEEAKEAGHLWEDHPQRELGDHDGLPDAIRKSSEI